MVKNFVLGDNAVQIIETGNHYGNMNASKDFYPEDWTYEMRWSTFLKRRMQAGKDGGFDGRRMFMADQEHKRGTWFEITKDYLKSYPEGWSDIPQDILIVTDKTPGVVIGHPVADCPVVMAYDAHKKALAIGHCSSELIDKRMPMLVIDALEQAHGSRDEDILAYISACAGTTWTYDRYPAWAKDEKVWDGIITLKEDGLYHINLKKAVLRQLMERKVGGVMMSPIDTITNPEFYSNSAARKDLTKKGRNYAGAFFR